MLYKCSRDNDPQNLVLPTIPSLLQVSSYLVRFLIYKEHPVVFWTLSIQIFLFLLNSDVGSIRGRLSTLQIHSNVPILSQEFLPVCLSLSICCLYVICSELGKDFFKNQPIRNKNFLWRPCLLMDRDKMSNLYRGPSIDGSYQGSVHLAERFQR